MLIAFPQTYLLAIAYHGITGATGFQNFFPTLTESLVGEDQQIKALLLVAPPYLFMVFWSYLHAFGSDKLQQRYWFFIYPIPIVFVGCFIFMFTNSFGPRYFSLFLLNFAFAMNNTVSRHTSLVDKLLILTANFRSTPGPPTPFPVLPPNVPLPWHS